ncbi:MAG: vitamin K epoxide reductase family protein [Acidobacteriaceae bacterium]
MSSPSTAENKLDEVTCEDKQRPVHKGLAIACCCGAIASLVPVALFQLHVLEDLPDPPGRIFDSKKIVTSKSAYRFGIPDGALGVASYGVTLGLLIAARPSRPLARKALRCKLALDGTMAVRNARRQVTQYGRICSWCMGAAVATAGMVYFARKAGAAERLRRA